MCPPSKKRWTRTEWIRRRTRIMSKGPAQKVAVYKIHKGDRCRIKCGPVSLGGNGGSYTRGQMLRDQRFYFTWCVVVATLPVASVYSLQEAPQGRCLHIVLRMSTGSRGLMLQLFSILATQDGANVHRMLLIHICQIDIMLLQGVQK